MQLKKYFNLISLTVIIYSLYGVFGAALAFATSRYSMPFYLFKCLITYSCIPLGLLLLIKQNKYSYENLFLFCLPLFYFLVSVFYSYEKYSGEWGAAFLVISYFMLFSDDIKLKIFKLTFYLFLFQCLFSIVVWIGYIFNLPIGLIEVPYYSFLQTDAIYIKCGIFAIFRSPIELRLCGIYIEPGLLGTLCALFFVATYYISKKWQKIILLVTGLFTYSLAFYIIIFLFICFNYIQCSYKHLIWLIFLPIIFISIPKIDFGNETINHFTKRFEFSTEKGLVGNNRNSELYDYEFNLLMHSPKFLTGYGIGYRIITTDLKGNWSYKQFIAEMGILGFGFFLLLWIWCVSLKAKRNIKCYLLFILCLCSVYQRPEILISGYGYIIIFGGFEYIKFYTIHYKK